MYLIVTNDVDSVHKPKIMATWCLLGANYTVQFPVLVVWWAGEVTMGTRNFNVVKEGSISVSHTIRQGLLVSIHTLKC